MAKNGLPAARSTTTSTTAGLRGQPFRIGEESDVGGGQAAEHQLVETIVGPEPVQQGGQTERRVGDGEDAGEDPHHGYAGEASNQEPEQDERVLVGIMQGGSTTTTSGPPTAAGFEPLSHRGVDLTAHRVGTAPTAVPIRGSAGSRAARRGPDRWPCRGSPEFDRIGGQATVKPSSASSVTAWRARCVFPMPASPVIGGAVGRVDRAHEVDDLARLVATSLDQLATRATLTFPFSIGHPNPRCSPPEASRDRPIPHGGGGHLDRTCADR